MEEYVQATSWLMSEMLITDATSCEVEGNKSTEGHDVTLPRKASSEVVATRTANRHR